MIPRAQKILITGPPGCGKTTVIMRVISSLAIEAKGFYTEEVRGKDGRRIGFDIVTLSGKRGSLARIDAHGPRIGKYGVCLGFLENSAICEIFEREKDLAVIDEIGKMECVSKKFTQAVKALLDSGTPVVGTIALVGSPFIREVRSRSDIELIEVTEKNREGLVEDLLKRFGV